MYLQLFNVQDLGQSTSSSGILRTIVNESIMESSFAESTAPGLDTTGTTSELEGITEDTESAMESSQAGDTSILSSDECAIPASRPPAVTVPVATEHMQTWCGFRLVGDNIDKNVRPSFQRIDRRTQSIHYFNVYAVMDRVDMNGFCDEPVATTVFPNSLLPQAEDIAAVKEDFVTLVSR